MGQTKPLAFAGIADRLGKLIPRLASDHDGEVVATVSAIGRTLQGAGLDWHDLSERVTAPKLADVMPMRRPQPQPEPEPWSSPGPSSTGPVKPPGCSDHDWERAMRRARGEQRPKKEPPPWPTWGTLSHFGKLACMDAILRDGDLSPTDLKAFRAFHGPYYRNQEWSRKDVNTFNRHIRTMWERGWRPQEKAA